MTPSRAAVVVLGCSSLFAAGCGDDGDDDNANVAMTATVNIASFQFAPASVTIAAGGSVTWVNQDKAPHTAENTGEQGPAQFDTGRLTRGERKTTSFSRPGTYPYYCVFHRFMRASVIVR